MTERYETAHAKLTQALDGLQDRGEIAADLDPAVTATNLMALMDGLQLRWALDPTVDIAASFEAVARTILAIKLVGATSPADDVRLPGGAAPRVARRSPTDIAQKPTAH